MSGLWVSRGTPIIDFVEIAPLMNIIHETDFSFNGGLSVGFFFNLTLS